MRAAIVLGGVVTNIIVADAAVDQVPSGCILVDVTDRECDIDWLYDYATDAFTNPTPPLPNGIG